MTTIAIDIGSGLTKVVNGISSYVMPSIVGEFPGNAFGTEKYVNEFVQFDGKTYCLGEAATRIVKPESRFNTLSKNWPLSKGYTALLYGSIAKALPRGHTGKIYLCTGLPVSYYESKKNVLIEGLCRHHEFKVGTKKYKIDIDKNSLKIVPQATGLFFYNKIHNGANGSQGYIDFGTHTTGCVKFEDNDYINWAADGANVGGASVMKKLKSFIEERYSSNVDIDVVRKALLTKSVLIQGEKIDLTDPIKRIAREEWKPLAEKIKSLWSSDNMNVYVGGGFGDLFYTSVKETFDHASIIESDEDSCMHVVRGYQLFIDGAKSQRKVANG